MSKTKSPYEEGYEAALVPLLDQKPNPYQEGTEAHKEWCEGFDDGTDDYIAWIHNCD